MSAPDLKNPSTALILVDRALEAARLIESQQERIRGLEATFREVAQLADAKAKACEALTAELAAVRANIESSAKSESDMRNALEQALSARNSAQTEIDYLREKLKAQRKAARRG